MSAEELHRFAEATRAKPELLAGYDEIDNPDALVRRLRQDGYDVTREDLDAARAAAGELTSEQLDAIAGGTDLRSKILKELAGAGGISILDLQIAEIDAEIEAARSGAGSSG